MAAQDQKCFTEIVPGTVTVSKRGTDGLFSAKLDNDPVHTRTVQLATGVVGIEPELPDLFRAIHPGLIRHCRIYDGYEVIDHRVRVIGRGDGGLREVSLLRTYTDDFMLHRGHGPGDDCGDIDP